MNTLSKRTEYTAAILAVLIPVVTGTLWIGSVANTASGAEQAVGELRTDLKQMPSDVAVLKEQVSDLKRTIAEISDEQKVRDAALLKALQKVAEGHR